MANVLIAGLEAGSSGRLSGLLHAGHHDVRYGDHKATVEQLLATDIVFAGGDREHYLALLQRARAINPGIAFVVVARLPETSDWLEALEAGVTDYCATPLDAAEIRRVMEFSQGKLRVGVA
jgi:DNA-binding NtrC family response regulator